MDIDLSLRIVIPLSALILGKYLDRWLTKRPKLISYLGHTSVLTLKGEVPITIHTHSIVVRNAGRVATNNIRIGHYILPQDFQLIPPIHHLVEQEAGDIAEIVIPKLVPDEQITITYLYLPPLLWSQIHAYTKSDEGFAKILNVLPTPQFPKWVSHCMWVLVIMGIAAIIYLLAELFRLLV
jgi:hypothetical protein